MTNGMLCGSIFGGCGGWGWGLGIWGLILNIALIVGVVLLIIWVVRRAFPNSGGGGFSSDPSSPDSAREILRIRYARGEISREQYQEMLAEIS